jgi:hypothetical protein
MSIWFAVTATEAISGSVSFWVFWASAGIESKAVLTTKQRVVFVRKLNIFIFICFYVGVGKVKKGYKKFMFF